MEQTPTQVIEWTLGERLAKARRMKGWNQTELATSLGIGRRSISRYEDDIARPSRAVLIAWAEVTDVPLTWLEGDASVTRRFTLRSTTHRRTFVQVMSGFAHPSTFAMS
jgi:transcriptional regulator with XRE-family HTH domain